VPDGQRIYAIGDIHGRLDLLEKLIEAIRQDDESRGKAGTMLILLGDLVDRGPDSAGVIERLRQLRDSGAEARFILGNHDEVFLKAAGGDIKALRMLTRIGGRETMLSYGISSEEYRSCSLEDLAALLSDKVPKEHIDFLSLFENYAEIGDYLFVHAGIRPGVAIDEQSPADLRWIRGDFINCRNFHEKMIVHGHNIKSEVDICHNRIGIDTGAFASGRLTAIGLQGQDNWFLSATGPIDPKWGRVPD
jgi:serine/threonine protein phosphatase 1